MAYLSEKAIKFRQEYIKKFNKPPRGWFIGTETMEEYEEYLKNEMERKV